MSVDWSRFSSDPRSAESRDIRASDADRDAALDALRDAYSDGRLSKDEHEERSAGVLGSRTLDALVPFLSDLEAGVPATRSAREVAEKKFRDEAADWRSTVVWVSSITTVIWVITAAARGELYFFWPIFPIGILSVLWALEYFDKNQHIEAYERKELKRRAKQAKSKRDNDPPKPAADPD